MDDEIELFGDDDGFAVVGTTAAVERFLTAAELASRNLDLSRVGDVLRAGSVAAQSGSAIAAHSGRWVKLTAESAARIKTFGLTPTTTPGVMHAMVGKRGEIKNWVQILATPGAMVTNPAILAGAAGIMSQVAMQQAMDEITDYLATIDEKLDAVLRIQMNQILARMDGVDLAIREATSVREAVGRVSEVTWSKVQSSAATILETQGFALRQLGDLADKIEEKRAKVEELVKTTKESEAEVQKWLAVLARCFQLHDAMAVLELDRVMDASPDELDRHRLGLQAARRDRLELISRSTENLLVRMIAAAGTANSKVLLNPIQSPAIVASSNRVVVEVHEFHNLLGIDSGAESSETRRWTGAASERWEKLRETGAEGIGTAKHLTDETRTQVKSVKGKLAGKLAERKLRRTEDAQPSDPEDSVQASHAVGNLDLPAVDDAVDGESLPGRTLPD